MSDLASSLIRELRDGFKPTAESGLILWPHTIRGLLKKLRTIEEMALETEAELRVADMLIEDLRRQLRLREQRQPAPSRDNVVSLMVRRFSPAPNGGGDAA